MPLEVFFVRYTRLGSRSGQGIYTHSRTWRLAISYPCLTPPSTYSATMSLKGAPGFYNPAVQTVQGANSKTFTSPGIDTTLTIPELFEFHAKHSPQHPVFVYADDDEKEHVIHFPEVYHAIRKAATISSAHYNRLSDYYEQAQVGKSEDEPPVIGILATAGTHARTRPSPHRLCAPYRRSHVCAIIPDSISFYTLEAGLMYLGLTAFPISTRNSAIAVAHLVAKIGVRQMYVSADPAMQRLAQEANELLAKDGPGNAFEALPMPDFEDLYGPGGDGDGDDALVPMGRVSPDKTCIIIHSSGESGPADLPASGVFSVSKMAGAYVGMQGRLRPRSRLSFWIRTSGSGGRSYVSAFSCWEMFCACFSPDITVPSRRLRRGRLLRCARGRTAKPDVPCVMAGF